MWWLVCLVFVRSKCRGVKTHLHFSPFSNSSRSAKFRGIGCWALCIDDRMFRSQVRDFSRQKTRTYKLLYYRSPFVFTSKIRYRIPFNLLDVLFWRVLKACNIQKTTQSRHGRHNATNKLCSRERAASALFFKNAPGG